MEAGDPPSPPDIKSEGKPPGVVDQQFPVQIGNANGKQASGTQNCPDGKCPLQTNSAKAVTDEQGRIKMQRLGDLWVYRTVDGAFHLNDGRYPDPVIPPRP